MSDFAEIFSTDMLDKIFPREKADEFFEALFGDRNEGAYDISLKYRGNEKDELIFDFNLDQRPGKCLGCSVTYGLPGVFKKHPVINIKSVVDELSGLLDSSYSFEDWRLGNTISVSKEKHLIPLHLKLK